MRLGPTASVRERVQSLPTPLVLTWFVQAVHLDTDHHVSLNSREHTLDELYELITAVHEVSSPFSSLPLEQ